MKTNNTIRQGMLLASALAITSLLAMGVYASGVVSSYWDSPGEQYSLRLAPGESKVIQFELQNMVGENDVTFKVTLQSTQDVAQFVDSSTTYLVKHGESQPVPVRITIPSSAQIEEKYRVTLTTQEIKGAQLGQLSVGSGFENSFNVIVTEKPRLAPSASGNVSNVSNVLASKQGVISLVILVLIIIALVIWFRKRKQ